LHRNGLCHRAPRRNLRTGGKRTNHAETLQIVFAETLQDNLTNLERQRFDALGRIALLVAQRDLAAQALDAAVKEARDLDLPWTRISRAVGVTPQSAQRKWDPKSKQTHREYQRDRYRSARYDAGDPGS
jgi:hypothetical protein